MIRKTKKYMFTISQTASASKFPLKLEWLSLVTIFLMAGIIGHDPWKQDETYSFGIIYHFYTTHSWLVPTNAGVPFMEKPPLYYWTSVVFCKMLGGILPLHDAARCASFFYMLIASTFMWKIARLLPLRQPETSWTAIALFFGSLGLVRHAHDMFTDVALLAGTTMAFYGMMQLANEKPAALWLGLGVGVAFLSKGFLVPVMLGASLFVLLFVLPQLRTMKTFTSLLTAFLVASPLLFIWPYFLYQYSPELFHEWFWENNVGRFLGYSVPRLGANNTPYYFLYTVWWFAFPVFPLAVMKAMYGRKQWQRPEYIVPVVTSAIGITLLCVSASARALYLLPLFPAFALLATLGLEHCSSYMLILWNRVIRVLFTLSTVIVWLLWWNLISPADARPIPFLATISSTLLPFNFSPSHGQILACSVAALATILWIASWRLPSKDPLNTAYIWFSGIANLWIGCNTLLLPWIDETKSYRPVIENMKSFLRHSPYEHECIGTYQLGESIPPMLEYFGDQHSPGVPQGFDGNCNLLLMDGRKDESAQMDSRWVQVWKGERILDAKNRELRLYARIQK